MNIIPAIDIIDGKCVRLSKGDFNTKKVYNEHPLEVAKVFEAHGIQRLHLVDLDGARAKKIVNYKVLESLATATNLTIDFGGGLQSDADVQIAFDCGAAQITGGSIAVKNRALFLSWLSRYGAARIILGADVHGDFIATSGWTETSQQELQPFITSYFDQGIRTVICTDISKDGMLEGPAINLYKSLLESFESLELIASGGVSKSTDLVNLATLGCHGAIVGKAIYEGRITLKEIENFIQNGY